MCLLYLVFKVIMQGDSQIQFLVLSLVVALLKLFFPFTQQAFN